MIQLLTIALILLGSFFMLVAAVGVLRLPDLLLRMHAATKAGTLGAGLMLLSVAVVYGETSVFIRSLAAVVFLLLTAPVAAHMIGRAAYLTGDVQLWERTFIDELATHYDQGVPGSQRKGSPDSTRQAPPESSRQAP